MSRVFTVIALLGVVVAVCAWWISSQPDPNEDPTLSLPPPIVAADAIASRRALFDGRTPAGWRIDGAHRIKDWSLELGGDTAATAALEKALEEGAAVEFDFFQEGVGGAALHIEPVLLAPQQPDPEFAREVKFDLSLAEFVYKRWHHVTVRASRQGTNTHLNIDIEAHHGGPGRGGGAVHSLPARGGCRHQLTFKSASGSRLYLRNVFLRPTITEKH